jgi:hypothetical protein
LNSKLTSSLHRLANAVGFDMVRHQDGESFAPDFDQEAIATIRAVRPYTMTSPERVFALREATKYIVKGRIPGAIVECGVWRGGSMMAVARTLLELNERDRELFLFDTYEGMPPPTEHDVAFTGESAESQLKATTKDDPDSVWCYASLEDVTQSVNSVGYPTNKIHFVKGKVEDTIPATAPETIALLRLDTDWYESTRHELVHLFPRLSRGGVIVIDDYGHWQGARQAVDGYLAEHGISLLLNRVDYTGRMGVVI